MRYTLIKLNIFYCACQSSRDQFYQ